MSAVLHANRQAFTREVLQSGLPVLVDFHADWCGPCRMPAPALERLATECAGRVKIVKVSIDAEPALADEFQVSSIPALLVLMSGREVGRTNRPGG